MSLAIKRRRPDLFVEGLYCTNNATDSDHDVDISAGSCRDDADTYDIVSSGTLTGAIDASGANGLDTGVVAANTWYSLWVIADASAGTVAGLFSTSTTEAGLTYPGSYDVARRVGWVLTDASSNIRGFAQSKGGNHRVWTHEVDYDDFKELTAGTATTMTAVDVSAAVPPGAIGCQAMALQLRTASAIDAGGGLGWNPVGNQNRNWGIATGLAAGNDSTSSIIPTLPMLDGTDSIIYRVGLGTSSMDIFVTGWEDSL
ncbi:MAG: hypothetical protein V3S01_07915 [Dehalococcoidia bacterium]